MKKTVLAVLLAAVVALMLLTCGCWGEAATTTTSATTPATATTTLPTTTSTSATTTTSSTSTTSTTLLTGPLSFTAELSGSEVVPAVDTLATGSATFTIDPSGTKASFVLKLSNISDVIASRVHEGKPGTNGPGVLILYPGPTQTGTFTGTLAQGNFNASVLIGSLTGKTIADFAALLASGEAYVNVGTTKNPEGEIRGQIH